MSQAFKPVLIARTESLLTLCRAKKLRIATAESCTGGLLSALLTEIPGCSDVFDRGFVTYSNNAKHAMLGVPMEIFTAAGAVSAECAEAMAKGALSNSEADLAISITGVAGPKASERKLVGLVYQGVSSKTNPAFSRKFNFNGTREKIRMDSITTAIDNLMEFAESI